MLSLHVPAIHAGLHVLREIKWRVPTTRLYAIWTVTIQEHDQNSMKFDVHIVDAYKLRNKFVHIYNNVSSCTHARRVSNFSGSTEEIIKNIRYCFLTDLNTSVQVQVSVKFWATILLLQLQKELDYWWWCWQNRWQLKFCTVLKVFLI